MCKFCTPLTESDQKDAVTSCGCAGYTCRRNAIMVGGVDVFPVDALFAEFTQDKHTGWLAGWSLKSTNTCKRARVRGMLTSSLGYLQPLTHVLAGTQTHTHTHTLQDSSSWAK